MKSRKGVQLVMAAVIGLILLILLLVFVIVGGFGTLSDLFGDVQDSKDVSETAVVAAKNKCQNWCLEAKQSKTPGDWQNSDFCTQKIVIGEENAYCGGDLIKSKCDAIVKDATGDTMSCNQNQMCSGKTTSPDDDCDVL